MTQNEFLQKNELEEESAQIVKWLPRKVMSKQVNSWVVFEQFGFGIFIGAECRI